MRRSTSLTRALGAGALIAAAAAQVLVYVPADAPRLDILGALAAALVLTIAWALTCRTAPPLAAAGPAPPDIAETHETNEAHETNGAHETHETYEAPKAPAIPAIPAQLPGLRGDLGRTLGTALIAAAPITLAWLAIRSTGILDAALFGIVAAITLKLTSAMRRAMVSDTERTRLKVLIEDAAAGEVHGIRVRAGQPQHLRYSERGDRPGSVSVSNDYFLTLHDAKGEEIPLAVDRLRVAELSRAGTLLTDRDGWLIWPRRHKLIEDAQPVAFVADHDGSTILGLTAPSEVTHRSDTASARDPHPTSRDRTARALPRTTKFRTPIHGPIAGGALLAALLCAPVLLLDKDDLSGFLSWPLCVLAGAALLTGVSRGTSATLDCTVADAEWTVREESDPDIT
ncbi:MULTISPECIES: hypothetical protein [unclassified Streptomyces]|uniref:hypothetical protein n=1 Tax=unclassified Streptomyces TaxID=2593676 RepID=UPI00278C7D7A|nr:MULTISPECIES: hypothetical protein [unclassified Streptomyces]